MRLLPSALRSPLAALAGGAVLLLTGASSSGCRAWEREQMLLDLHGSEHQRCPSLEKAREMYGEPTSHRRTIASWDQGPFEERIPKVPRGREDSPEACRWLTKVCRYVVTTAWEPDEPQDFEELAILRALPCE